MISVLYVDDEPNLLEITKLFLEKDGDIFVDTAESAQKAIEMLENKKYDAIVSDYLMPKMDGIEFLKNLRKNGCSTPFLIFTGRGREEVVIEAFDNGADFYIQKGGEPRSQFAELVHKIRQSVTRQEAEQALLESEKKFRDLFEQSLQGIIISDEDSRIVAWNRAMEDLTGLSAGDALGSYLYDIISFLLPDRKNAPMIREKLKKEYEDFQKAGSAEWMNSRHNIKIIRSDGEVIHAINTIFSIPEKRGYTVANLFLAVTPKKDTLDELKSRKGLYSRLAELVPGMIYVVNEKGVIEYVNNISSSRFGLSPEDLIGKTLYEIFPETLAERHLKAIRSVMEKGEPLYCEIYEKFPSGQCWIEARLLPVPSEEGSIVAVMGISFDISDRKNKEIELMQAKNKLRVISEFTTYDMSNIMAVIQEYCQLAKDKSAEPALKEILDKQKTSIVEMGDIISFIRDYESLGSSPPVFIDIKDLIGQLSKKKEAAGVSLKIEMPDIEIYSDRIFNRIFFELIINSLKHAINLTEIRFSCRHDDRGIVLLYEDNGRGIPGDEKERIFEKGYGKGTGNGLYFIYKAIGLLGMSIKEKGVPGEGARFEILVPKEMYRISDKTDKI